MVAAVFDENRQTFSSRLSDPFAQLRREQRFSNYTYDAFGMTFFLGLKPFSSVGRFFPHGRRVLVE